MKLYLDECSSVSAAARIPTPEWRGTTLHERTTLLTGAPRARTAVSTGVSRACTGRKQGVTGLPFQHRVLVTGLPSTGGFLGSPNKDTWMDWAPASAGANASGVPPRRKPV